jgi:osmoprotectant transport system permease protein
MNPLATLLPVAQEDPFVRDPAEQAMSCEAKNDTVCIGWAFDNIDRYVTPTLEHLVLVGVSVVAGFLIAFALTLISHQRRWLVPPVLGATGILYTIPSVAFFVLLLPIAGRGQLTAIIALTAYTLQIIYRNIITGLNNVPEGAMDAGRGMGMTPNQLFWRVELPLSVPEIVAGLRIATVSTVAIATLAFLAGGGGLGTEFTNQIDFKTNVLIATGLCVTMAIIFDLLLLLLQAFLLPWRSATAEREGMSARFFEMFRRTAT